MTTRGRNTALLRWWPVLLGLVLLLALAAWGQRHLPGFGAPIPCELSPKECQERAEEQVHLARTTVRLLAGLSLATILAVPLVALRTPHEIRSGGSAVAPHALVAGLAPALVYAAALPLVLFVGFLIPAWMYVGATAAVIVAIVLTAAVHRHRAPHWGPRLSLLLAWAATLPGVLTVWLTFLLRPDGMWPLAVALALLLVSGPLLVVLVRRRTG